MNNGKLQKAADLGLDRLTEYLDKVGRGARVSDDERLAAKVGLGTVSTAVRLESAETNRMMVELAQKRFALAGSGTPRNQLKAAS